MKTPARTAAGSQSTLKAMEVYFDANAHPDRLRVSESGEISVAGKFSVLLDRCSHHFQKTFNKKYKAPDWRETARQEVISKLERSLKSMMPWYAKSSRQFAETLLSNITHQVSSQHDITWQRALQMQLELTRSSPRELAMSNAVRLLTDLNQINHPGIEKNIIEKIGSQCLDLEYANSGNHRKIKEAFSEEIATHLANDLRLSKEVAAFGGKVLLHAMFVYDLDLEKAKKMLHMPESLQQRGNSTEPIEQQITRFIQASIEKTLHEQLGLRTNSAKNIAPAVEFCMCRYHLDLMQALDLASLAQAIAVQNPEKIRPDATTPTSIHIVPVLKLRDMDKARAIQQVMARDQCDFHTAIEIVDRRIAALPSITQALPPNTVASIVNGFQFNLHSAISDKSKVYLRENVISLQNLRREPWKPAGRSTPVALPSVYLQDSTRTLLVVLHENETTQYFDSRDADKLTDSIYQFAGDDHIMQAICDSINQTIKGTILKIICKMEQHPVDSKQLMLHPGINPTGIQGQLAWNTVTKDGQGNLIVRNIFLQKHAGIIPMSPIGELPMNQGDHWKGDVSPANAGLMFDFSYAFKLSDLKQGIHNPKILDCHYSIRGSLDWDEIDPMLTSSPPSSSPFSATHGT